MNMPLETDMFYDRYLTCKGMGDTDNFLNFSSSCFVAFTYHVLLAGYLSQLLVLLSKVLSLSRIAAHLTLCVYDATLYPLGLHF